MSLFDDVYIYLCVLAVFICESFNTGLHPIVLSVCVWSHVFSASVCCSVCVIRSRGEGSNHFEDDMIAYPWTAWVRFHVLCCTLLLSVNNVYVCKRSVLAFDQFTRWWDDQVHNDQMKYYKVIRWSGDQMIRWSGRQDHLAVSHPLQDLSIDAQHLVPWGDHKSKL